MTRNVDQGLKIKVITIIKKPCGKTIINHRHQENSFLNIKNKFEPNIDEFFNDVDKIVSNKLLPQKQRPRIYWRILKSKFMSIKNYLDLNCAIKLMLAPRIYTILNESTDEDDDDDNIITTNLQHQIIFSDIDILRSVTSDESNDVDDNYSNNMKVDYFSNKNENDDEIIYTREYDEVYRKLNILIKGFPRTDEKKSEQFSEAKSTSIEELDTIKSESVIKSKSKSSSRKNIKDKKIK